VFCNLILDLGRLVRTAVRSRAALSAEILFLRKQLAFYQEHEVKPRRLTDSARAALLALYRLFNWRDALVIVKPETLIRWHRRGSGYSGVGNAGLGGRDCLRISASS